MILPTIPHVGKPVRADTIRRIIYYLRAITPRPSDKVLPRVGPGGTTFDLVEGSATGGGGLRGLPYGSIHPFGLISESRSEISLASGEIPALYGGQPQSVAAQTVDISTVGNGTCWIQLSVALHDTDTLTKGAYAVSAVASAPASTADELRTWLYRYTLTDDAATLTKHNLLHAFTTLMPRTVETAYTGLIYDPATNRFIGASFGAIPATDPQRVYGNLTPETLIQFVPCDCGGTP